MASTKPFWQQDSQYQHARSGKWFGTHTAQVIIITCLTASTVFIYDGLQVSEAGRAGLALWGGRAGRGGRDGRGRVKSEWGRSGGAGQGGATSHQLQLQTHRLDGLRVRARTSEGK